MRAFFLLHLASGESASHIAWAPTSSGVALSLSPAQKHSVIAGDNIVPGVDAGELALESCE